MKNNNIPLFLNQSYIGNFMSNCNYIPIILDTIKLFFYWKKQKHRIRKEISKACSKIGKIFLKNRQNFCKILQSTGRFEEERRHYEYYERRLPHQEEERLNQHHLTDATKWQMANINRPWKLASYSRSFITSLVIM